MNSKQTHADDRRTRWFADPPLQCGLIARTLLYWMYSVCAVGAIALIWIVLARHPQTPEEWIDQLWLNCGPLAVGSILMLPLVLLDSLRFSRRFAGPMVRFRRALNDLANGNPTAEINLRETDFWCDLARDLNRVSQRLQAQQLAQEASETLAKSRVATSVPKAESAPAEEDQSHGWSSPTAPGAKKSAPVPTPLPPAIAPNLTEGNALFGEPTSSPSINSFA